MTVTEMAAKVAAGQAERLFADDGHGPHYYAGRWWVARHGASGFEPVTDPDLSQHLTHETPARKQPVHRLDRRPQPTRSALRTGADMPTSIHELTKRKVTTHA